MEAYLIRHGETESNVNNGLIGGRSNHIPINPTGADQSKKLGDRLKRNHVTFDSVYASIALRTLQTASRVCEAIGFPTERIVQSDQIQELNQGDWEGKPRTEIYTPETLETIHRDNWKFAPPNGESQKMVEERMMEWLNGLKPNGLNTVDSRIIGVFTHGFAIRCLLRGLLNFDPKMTYPMEISNTSISRLILKNGVWIPISINDAAHLES